MSGCHVLLSQLNNSYWQEWQLTFNGNSVDEPVDWWWRNSLSVTFKHDVIFLADQHVSGRSVITPVWHSYTHVSINVNQHVTETCKKVKLLTHVKHVFKQEFLKKFWESCLTANMSSWCCGLAIRRNGTQNDQLYKTAVNNVWSMSSTRLSMVASMSTHSGQWVVCRLTQFHVHDC